MDLEKFEAVNGFSFFFTFVRLPVEKIGFKTGTLFTFFVSEKFCKVEPFTPNPSPDSV